MVLIPENSGTNFWKVRSTKVFSVNELDLESWRQSLDEKDPSSPLPKRRSWLVGTHSEDVLENLIIVLESSRNESTDWRV